MEQIQTWDNNTTKKQYLDYLIDPTLRNINRLFALSFRNIIAKDSLLRYYILLVEIKDFNVLIDNRPFFDHPLKNKQELCEKRIEMSRNDDYIQQETY